MPPARTGPDEPYKRADDPHCSDSVVQREAEPEIRASLSRKLGVAIEPRVFTLPDGSQVNVDGYNAGPPPILAEVFAHRGALKPGQRRKLLADAFKLATISRLLFSPDARLLLVVTEKETAHSMEKGWCGAALREHGIKVEPVEISPQSVARIVNAQARQQMVNAAQNEEGDE